jgi:uncharacterized protein YcfJ
MEAIKTSTRIHPLTAAAAVSVIIVSLAATAAIAGLLPSSHGAPEPAQPVASPAGYVYGPAAAAPLAPPVAAPAAYAPAAPAMYATSAQPVAAQYPVQVATAVPAAAAVPATYVVQPAPVVEKRAPVVHKTVQHKTVHHYTQTARYDGPSYAERPAPEPRQPNYLAIGTGAVVGGLLGNQVGSGNGRKLATVAGIIGGGMLGNEMANRSR